MENAQTEQILVKILQASLTGNLKPDSKLNPQHLAKAMVSSVNFSKSTNEIENERLITKLISIVNESRKEMNDELKTVKTEEKVLQNFIRGKITAYDELLEALKTL